ncbi:MAG: helix-turn-helix transcriptional regulator, partial [Bacilli bacterium]|nr:helix-turn-helix transcriptional regulator [Bacilli bacterium]
FPFGISEIETLDRKDIAAELKKLRIERGYNREEVAGLIQVHPVSLKEYEDAIRLIPIDKLYSILFVYEVDIDRFLEKIKKSRILYKN